MSSATISTATQATVTRATAERLRETDRSPRRYKLGKECRLRLKSLADGLFEKGESIYDFPLRMSYRILTREELDATFRKLKPEGIGKIQMLVTVPKKKRRHAVDRVLLRRRIREAYRINRHILTEALADRKDIGTLSVAFIYIHGENCDYHLIEKKMVRMLTKLRDRLPGAASAPENEE